MIHAHIALWIVGSPRFDKINVPQHLPNGVIEVDPDSEDVRVHSSEEAANLMACFWDRVLTEWNVAKAFEVHKGIAVASPQLPSGHENQQASHVDSSCGRVADLSGGCEDDVTALSKLRDVMGPRRAMGTKAERVTISPEFISVETCVRCLLETSSVSKEEDQQCWEEFEHIMRHCARCVDPAPESASSPLVAGEEGAPSECRQSPTASAPSSRVHGSSPLVAGHADSRKADHRRARARSAFVAALAEWVNMHDYHEPFPNEPPTSHQSCAAEDKGRIYCNKLYQRSLILPGFRE